MSVTGRILIAERLAALAGEMRDIAELMKHHPETEFAKHAAELGGASHIAEQWAKELEGFA